MSMLHRKRRFAGFVALMMLTGAMLATAIAPAQAYEKFEWTWVGDESLGDDGP